MSPAKLNNFPQPTKENIRPFPGNCENINLQRRVKYAEGADGNTLYQASHDDLGYKYF